MSDWISTQDQMPREYETDWVEIRKGDRVMPYQVKVWENHKGETDFVNALLEKEQGVTHWRNFITKIAESEDE